MMERKPSLLRGIGVFVLLGLLTAAGIAIGYGLATSLSSAPGTVTVTSSAIRETNASAPYVLTLVITTGNEFNSSAGVQPAFFVLGPNVLQSSAKISLPSNRLIKMVIVNYDDGNATLEAPDDNIVSGTTNGTIFVASNSNINASQGPAGIVLIGGQTLSSVPASSVAHTFSIPSLNLNIPVPLSSTVVAYFTVGKAGTYLWFCETMCGDAPMSTMGWMRGSVVSS
jgi:hypothetical protein